MGIHVGFNIKNPKPTQQSIKRGLKQAIQAGLSLTAPYTDWALLESKNGKYNKHELKEVLDNAKEKGLRPLLFIPAIDSEELVIPEYMKGEGNFDIIGNRRLDDPFVIERYKKLLDWVIPMASEYDAWGLLVGNEPDNYLDDHPEKTDEIVNFLIAVRDYAHTLNPKMAVTMSLNNGSIENKQNAFIHKIIKESDFAAYNFYCNDTIKGGVSYDEVKSRLNIRIKAAENKDIIFQELGCPSGSPNIQSPLISSEEKQRQWFETFFKIMQETPQIRGAYLFTLVDGDDNFAKMYNDILKEEGMPESFINYIVEAFSTIGLIDYKTGKFKTGWDEIIKGIKNTTSTQN
ncbi:MAG: hypothetical protein AB8B83_00010 [Bdellovibrionales bacterium]